MKAASPSLAMTRALAATMTLLTLSYAACYGDAPEAIDATGASDVAQTSDAEAADITTAQLALEPVQFLDKCTTSMAEGYKKDVDGIYKEVDIEVLDLSQGALASTWGDGIDIDEEWILSLIHISEPTRPY